MKRVHVEIRGVVQGVGYRLWVQSEADAGHLAGWVRNRRDGSVEAELEGPAEAVDDLVRRLHDGPRHARVDDVTATEATPLGEDRFEVRATA